MTLSNETAKSAWMFPRKNPLVFQLEKEETSGMDDSRWFLLLAGCIEIFMGKLWGIQLMCGISHWHNCIYRCVYICKSTCNKCRLIQQSGWCNRCDLLVSRRVFTKKYRGHFCDGVNYGSLVTFFGGRKSFYLFVSWMAHFDTFCFMDGAFLTAGS